MAKKQEILENESEEKKAPKVKKRTKEKTPGIEEKSSHTVLISSILVILMFVAMVFLIKLDIGGLGSKIIGPKIKNIPVLNLILPKSEKKDPDANNLTQYNFETIDEAIERLKATEIMLKEKEKEAEKLNEVLLLNKSEIERLKIFELDQIQFQEDKVKFDELVAKKADASSYMAYVEKTYPENALRIYESMVKEEQFNEEVDAVAKMYQEMKPKNAAAIIQQTVSTDIDMAAQILFKLDSTQAGAILAAMDPNVADKISRYMYPELN